MIGKTVTNYKILEKIGEGGMGSVYLGIHEKLERKVAIKVLNPELSGNTEIRERFINEAKTLSKLNHTNIVTLFDFADVNNTLFLIMEFIEGNPLDHVITNIVGPIPVIRCDSILKQILSGFSYAHTKGIIHRDIKPSNIILQSDDVPKILDFGIAKIIEGDKRLTKTGTRMGSVAYMSPEQVLGKDVDLRSDLYSLGVTFFEMLTGKMPYDLDNNSEYEIQHKIVQEPLPSVKLFVPSLPDKYDILIQKATAKNPNDRFYSCDEFINAIGGGVQQPQSVKTIYNTATTSNRTVIQQVNQPSAQIQTKSKKNTIYYLGGVLILMIAVFIIYQLTQSNDNQLVTNSKDNTKKSNTLQGNPINKQEIEEFVRNWATYQSNKMIPEYTSMYDLTFQGIKRTKSGKTTYLNYSEWISDRTKMYNQATNLNVTTGTINISNINESQGTAEVSFKQYYSSDKYSDEGQKIMKLKKDGNNNLKITFEELIYSQ